MIGEVLVLLNSFHITRVVITSDSGKRVRINIGIARIAEPTGLNRHYLFRCLNHFSSAFKKPVSNRATHRAFNLIAHPHTANRHQPATRSNRTYTGPDPNSGRTRLGKDITASKAAKVSSSR